MSRLKSIFAIAVLVAVAGTVQTANAQTLKVLIIGASGSWQAMAVGTYKLGLCPTGARPGCGHATYGKSNPFNVNDTRPGLKTGGGTVNDPGGQIWLVWDNTTADPNCTTSCNVWAYVKVDSVVGNRCFFGTPRCTIVIPSTTFTLGTDSQLLGTKAPIHGDFWDTCSGCAEAVPPATIQTLFTGGQAVNVAASEIRPEDALFAQCRVNSTAAAGGANDGLGGLNYGDGTNINGACPSFATSANASAYGFGITLTSAFPPGSSAINALAFNLSGHDPFTNAVIPPYTTIAVGASPLVFATDVRDGASGLGGVNNVSLLQLQTVFSGTSCLASDLGGGGNNINVFVREPLSGTMNSAEYTAFRLPRDKSGNYARPLSGGTVSGSQENGLQGLNPVSNKGCGAGGVRYRAVGTGDEVNFLLNSHNTSDVAVAQDGVGYFFFSYGNASKIAGSTNWSYLRIDNVDPIWQIYNTSAGAGYDPGQPPSSELPLASNLPAAVCLNKFPCNENQIWAGKLSFPNVRSGAYRQWITIRLIGQVTSTGVDVPATAAARALVASAQAAVVTKVPDFIPASPVTVGSGASAQIDPGMRLTHSHYTQSGIAPVNLEGANRGGDVGGCILPSGSVATKLVYRDPGPCVVGP